MIYTHLTQEETSGILCMLFEIVEIDMNSEREYTGFVRAGGVCSWDVGPSQTEAASNAVKQFKRDFRHVFKIKKGAEYNVAVFDTTGMKDWIIDDFGYLHDIKDGSCGDAIKDYEIVKISS